MSSYCKCGLHHKEDDSRLCAKCQAHADLVASHEILEAAMTLQDVWNTWKESCDTLRGCDEKYATLKRECMKLGWIPPQDGYEDNWSMQKFVTEHTKTALGHELVMPEEKGPFFAVHTSGKMRMYVTKMQRDQACKQPYWEPCGPTGEVIQ